MDFMCVFPGCVFDGKAFKLQTDMWEELLNENLIVPHWIWFPQLEDNQVSADDMLQMSLLGGFTKCFEGTISFPPCVPISEMNNR